MGVFVTATKSVVGLHKDYIQNSGHTEHALFVKSLLEKDGIAEIRAGPELASSLKRKGKKQFKQKRSERLINMLKAPGQRGVAKNTAEKSQILRKELALHLPGAVSDSTQKPLLHCLAESDENLCMARTQRASRCKNPRTCGSFCKKHFEEAQSQKYRLQLFDQLPASGAMDAWERSQMQLALSLSLEENEASKKKEEKSFKKIDKRLDKMGLQRKPMPREGACQFEAICHAAALPMTPLELRLAAVSYLEPLGNMFVDRLEAKFKGQWVGYIDYMKRQDSWGDDMTFMACSHILRRKIFVVTDSSDENHTIDCLLPSRHDVARSADSLTGDGQTL